MAAPNGLKRDEQNSCNGDVAARTETSSAAATPRGLVAIASYFTSSSTRRCSSSISRISLRSSRISAP
jgi:hypothetical protein